jgi:hypothetical protein
MVIWLPCSKYPAAALGELSPPHPKSVVIRAYVWPDRACSTDAAGWPDWRRPGRRIAPARHVRRLRRAPVSAVRKTCAAAVRRPHHHPGGKGHDLLELLRALPDDLGAGDAHQLTHLLHGDIRFADDQLFFCEPRRDHGAPGCAAPSSTARPRREWAAFTRVFRNLPGHCGPRPRPEARQQQRSNAGMPGCCARRMRRCQSWPCPEIPA